MENLKFVREVIQVTSVQSRDKELCCNKGVEHKLSLEYDSHSAGEKIPSPYGSWRLVVFTRLNPALVWPSVFGQVWFFYLIFGYLGLFANFIVLLLVFCPLSVHENLQVTWSVVLNGCVSTGSHGAKWDGKEWNVSCVCRFASYEVRDKISTYTRAYLKF